MLTIFMSLTIFHPCNRYTCMQQRSEHWFKPVSCSLWRLQPCGQGEVRKGQVYPYVPFLSHLLVTTHLHMKQFLIQLGLSSIVSERKKQYITLCQEHSQSALFLHLKLHVDVSRPSYSANEGKLQCFLLNVLWKATYQEKL